MKEITSQLHYPTPNSITRVKIKARRELQRDLINLIRKARRSYMQCEENLSQQTERGLEHYFKLLEKENLLSEIIDQLELERKKEVKKIS
ncbi:hypothetical protein KCM76_22825 [Zooshikella marina]|uniref:hypothetical protein n=1 Tax=Zooshikella ganghwensis TaxID=202772 RepID=UPI001BAEAEB5|nr:hypothetical protein [Zooshikella ganghwensis]MBU2708846.1 hypothetical protein [Zooshikella ganghwensis]